MSPAPAQRFEPSAPSRPPRSGFEPVAVTGQRFVSDDGDAREAEAPAPPTRAELEARERAAFERGVAEGRAALPWQEAEALARTLAALEQTARKLGALRRGHLVENRMALVELACGLAEQIVGRSLALRREALASLVERALAAAAPSEGPVVVRVAPADRAVLEAARGESAALRFEEDPSLDAGDVRIATRTGDVRASLAVALEQIRAGLEEALGAPDPDAPETSS